MYLQQILWHLYHVACHRDRFLPSGIPFQIWDTLAPYVVIHVNVLYRHWKILDFISLYDPIVVFNLWVTNILVHFPCLFISFDMSLAINFLVT